jgi:hypothetical protein
MHPCCWGNLFRELFQLLPFLAVLAVGLKQLVSPMVGLLKRLNWRAKKTPALSAVLLQNETEAVPSCCSSRAAD